MKVKGHPCVWSGYHAVVHPGVTSVTHFHPGMNSVHISTGSYPNKLQIDVFSKKDVTPDRATTLKCVIKMWVFQYQTSLGKWTKGNSFHTKKPTLMRIASTFYIAWCFYSLGSSNEYHVHFHKSDNSILCQNISIHLVPLFADHFAI